MLPEQIRNTPDNIQFKDVINYIDLHYTFTPTKFSNGNVINEAGQNNSSCKVFSLGIVENLSKEQVLNLFGEIYREEVLKNPEGNYHQNIRNFMEFGWDGISFGGEALKKKENVIE